jgi:beta-glucosidase
MVLLKNQDDLLPLDRGSIRKIAVIGPDANADPPVYSGGGSSMTRPFKVLNVLDGMREILGDDVEIVDVPFKQILLDRDFCQTGKFEKGELKAAFYNNMVLEGEPHPAATGSADMFRMGVGHTPGGADS